MVIANLVHVTNVPTVFTMVAVATAIPGRIILVVFVIRTIMVRMVFFFYPSIVIWAAKVSKWTTTGGSWC